MPVDAVASGRAARQRSPRRAQGVWARTADRVDPLAILAAQSATRVPELVAIRYGRMAATPFAFFRGATAVMAADLAAAATATGLVVQLCGDAHLVNFGAFAAPDRHLVFSINDFDETLPGPFEYDVKRLVASLAVLGRQRGWTASQRASMLLEAARTYREAMRDFARTGWLDVWYARLDGAELVRRWGSTAGTEEAQALHRATGRARQRDSHRALDKLTHVVDGERRFASRPPLLVRLADVVGHDHAERWASGVLRSFVATLSGDRRRLLHRYRYADAARKVVGVGSVGTRDWVLLLLGRGEGDPLLLQLKEAETSVLQPHCGASAYRNQGRRVVEGQRLMQAASDILLGWSRTADLDGVQRDYYVRQLWDRKGSLVIEESTERVLLGYAAMCGWTLARAHARSGDPVAIDEYLGRNDAFDRAMLAFGEAYADQNEFDHARLVAAIAAGDVDATSGV